MGGRIAKLLFGIFKETVSHVVNICHISEVKFLKFNFACVVDWGTGHIDTYSDSSMAT